ncbi:uncharacterized protein LOC111026217 [Myzus persicae]|uniref:uncharacterized protein LOC111026217 n=1 Tax=Myzus persicae TaxID=13164 RepID=UPI000B930A10|nr:uncharacterized protein LOC111026217 [Myzus persicae]
MQYILIKYLYFIVCRYLRCQRRRYGCMVKGKMFTHDGAQIEISPGDDHNHEPAPRHALGVRQFFNRLRERGVDENIAPHIIVDQETQMEPEAAMEIGRPAAIRAIARARRRNSPPVPESLSNWPNILSSIEWSQRLLYVNGALDQFYQGPLEVLRDDGTVRFVGIAFTNVAFLQRMNVHLRAVRTVCMDGTFQVRPRQPPDIEQLFTIQIVFNDVAIPIVHALLIDRQTESYSRVLQYFRHDLQLNLNYDQLQIISDFEQGLRNAIARVLPEANNTGCWFHFVQCIIRYVRTHNLARILRANENARRILRMLMALPHLPANEIRFHRGLFSIQLGFDVVQELG